MPQPAATTTAAASPLGRQMRGFALAGVIGFAIDAGLTAVFSHAFSLSPYLARPPAIAIAVVATWLVNRRIAFGSRDPRRMAELARYIAVSAVGAAINYLVYSALLLAAGASGLLAFASLTMLVVAVAGGSAAAMAFNFAGSRRFAFSAHGPS